MEDKNYPVQWMLDLYGFYRQKYVMMKPEFTNHIDGSYSAKQVWEHLNGNMSLCVFAGPQCTSFMSIDIDMKKPEVVHKVIDTMVELGFPKERIYVSDSGGKGYHVDVFFDNGTYNWMVRQLYDLIIYFGKLDKRKVEFRPTPTQAIKLPLGIHQKTGRRCWFVDRDTLEPIESFDYISTIEKINSLEVDKILKDGNKRRFYIMLEESKNANPGKQKKSKRSGGKEIIIDETGTRQRCMIDEALRLYRAGGDYNSIHRDLTLWLSRQDTSMYKDSWAECMRNINSITGWVMRCGRRHELGDDPNHDFHENTRIYRSDAERIITAPTKAARLLAFLITVYCDKYEFCGLSEKKLMETLSVTSKVTVIKAATALVNSGLFYKQKGGYHYIGNMLKPVTNKYKFPIGYERSGEYVEIAELVNSENIYRLYTETLAKFFDIDCIAQYLTAQEIKDIKEINSNDNKSGIHAESEAG